MTNRVFWLIIAMAAIWTVIFSAGLKPILYSTLQSRQALELYEPEVAKAFTESERMIEGCLAVEAPDELTIGTDGACAAFGMWALRMTEKFGCIYVTNEWVPSAKNPITHEWAQVLAEGY